MRWETTSWIGGMCTGRDVLSKPVLMHEGLINQQDSCEKRWKAVKLEAALV